MWGYKVTSKYCPWMTLPLPFPFLKVSLWLQVFLMLWSPQFAVLLTLWFWIQPKIQNQLTLESIGEFLTQLKLMIKLPLMRMGLRFHLPVVASIYLWLENSCAGVWTEGFGFSQPLTVSEGPLDTRHFFHRVFFLHFSFYIWFLLFTI